MSGFCTCFTSYIQRLLCVLCWSSYLCILCCPLIVLFAWPAANTRQNSAVCWKQHLIAVAFQYCKAGLCQVYLPRLARNPGSHLGKWKIQGVPGKRHFCKDRHGAMIKKRDRSHIWDTSPWMNQQQGAETLLKQRQKHRSSFLTNLAMCFASHSPWTETWWI